jgi:signal peptidase II
MPAVIKYTLTTTEEKGMLILLAIIIFAAAADQISKLLIYGHDMAVIPGVVCFRSVENHGMVWGIMNNVSGLMIAVCVFTAIVIALLIFALVKYRARMSKPIAVSLACVAGGAIGNLIDRIALGFVRDFICTEFIDFPVFNVADCFITCGAIALAVFVLFTKKGRALLSEIFPDEKEKKAKQK